MFSEVLSLLTMPPSITSILFNPSIPDSLSLGRIMPWVQASFFQLRNMVDPFTHRLSTFEALWENVVFCCIYMLYFYLQIKHFFHSLSPSQTLDKPTSIEYLLYVPKVLNNYIWCPLYTAFFMKLSLLLKILIYICVNGHNCYVGLSPPRCGIGSGLLLLNPPNVWYRERHPLKFLCSGIGPLRSYIIMTPLEQ